MATRPAPIQAQERVLSTLNVDGSRRWIRPKPSAGRWWKRRRITAYVLMLVFFIVPYLSIGGRPVLLIDLPRREFSLLGTTFYSTDTLLFMLLLVSILIGIFLATALFGRVWCGWACPQTVYMEFLFRPVERLFEGGDRGSKRLDRQGGFSGRRVAKNAFYLVLALFLAHTFLAYFVPPARLWTWMQGPPAQHWTSFFIVMFTTGLIFFDFAYFREQTCLVACPYGRIQSALLDKGSLIVGYDGRRGEPRAKGARPRPEGAGDCVDCGLCVLTCPTGIDIREGLQMECVHCTQCMDACDRVMANVGKAPGLIRYGSRNGFEGAAKRRFRMRVVAYPLVLVATLGLFSWALASRSDTDVTVLRGGGEPFVVQADGRVLNTIRIKVRNFGADRRYGIALEGAPGAQLVAPINPLPVRSGKWETATVFVLAPRGSFRSGMLDVEFIVQDGERLSVRRPYRLVGPEDAAPAAPTGGASK